MAKEVIAFETFLGAVAPEYREYVAQVHQYLTENGCEAAIQEKKSGFFISYTDTKTKLSVVNFLFRKKGMIIRIFGGNVNQYTDFVEKLPAGMVAAIKKAPVCKRLIDPTKCSPTCPMGNDFYLQGEHMQKCRNNCFMFDVSPENNPYIKEFIALEIQQRLAQR